MRSALLPAFCSFTLSLPSLIASPPEGQGTVTKSSAPKVVFDQVAQRILPNGKYCADNHSGDGTLKEIKSKGVSPDFAVLMRPADEAPFELRRQYVMVMAELEPPSSHFALIEKLVSERPGDHDLLALQLVAAPTIRRRELTLAMARDPENDLRALEERLPPLLDADQRIDAAAYRTMLENWRIVVDLFTAFPPEQSPDKYIYSFDPLYLLFGSSADQIGIPPFLPVSSSTPTPSPELAALALQRNETLYAVAMGMHANPASTRKAFAILHYGRDVFHLDEARLRQLALHSCQIILRDEDEFCRKESFDLGIFVNLRPGRFSETRREFPGGSAGVTPYGYLLDLAVKNQKFHDSSEFLQCLSRKNRKNLKAGLDFFSEPAPARARRILPKWVAEDEPIPAAELALPAAIAGLCGIDTHKGFSTLLATTRSSKTPYRQYQQVELLALWANVSLEHRNITLLAAIIQEARQRFIGQPESPDSLSGSDAIGAILYRTHCPPDECALVRVLLATHFPDPTYNFPSAPNLSLPESPSASARLLLASHLFHRGPGMFDDDGMISTSDDLGFLPFAVIRYKPKEKASETEDSSNRNLGLELLKTNGPERFWARITGAYLAKQDATIVAAELEHELTAIKTWPAPEQHSLAKFLLARWPDLNRSAMELWFKQTFPSSPPKSR